MTTTTATNPFAERKRYSKNRQQSTLGKKTYSLVKCRLEKFNRMNGLVLAREKSSFSVAPGKNGCRKKITD